MQQKKIMAMLMVSLFFTAGCLGALEEEVEIPDIDLPLDWKTIVPRAVSTPDLVEFDDCDDLENRLKDVILEDYRIQLLQAVEEQYYYFWDDMILEDGMMAEADDSATGGSSPPTTTRRVEGTDFSGTNNQESGVDEADVVKTDGYYIYFLNGKKLEIMGVPEFGELVYQSNTTIEGNPQSMLLDGDRLVVISSVSSWNIPASNPLYQAMEWDEEYSSWRTYSLTKFSVFDISDRSDIELERELFIEGSYITAREVDGTIRTVTHAWMETRGLSSWLDLPEGYWSLDYDNPLRLQIREEVAYQTMLENEEVIADMSLSDLVPRIYERQGDSVLTHSITNDDCASFVAPQDGFSRGINSIFSFDITAADFDFEADHIIGNYPLVYSSADALILAEKSWDSWWFWNSDDSDEATNIHMFDISDPGTTEYIASGRVDGTIQDQFSLSEYQGVIRVASTEGQWGRWWLADPEPMTSNVVTLQPTTDATGHTTLEQIGIVEGIAPNETIWSARFVEDRAYIVTFENMDPLWTIDLSDPTNPVIMGELKIPGVSTYIHPISEDTLLTIGMGPADLETGEGLDWSNVRLSLFDVSDFTNPLETTTLTISPVEDENNPCWSWSNSEATYEHKAFQYWAPKSMLAVPMNTYTSGYYDYETRTYTECPREWVSKLMITNVTETSLTSYGEVDHSEFYDSEQYWWNSYNIRRSIFMGNYIYAISANGITATNLTTMENSASLQLEYQNPYESYYRVVEEGPVESEEEDKGEEEAESESSDDDGATPVRD
ncbi:MAG TPA: hypothetical protein HA359_00700 [Candidatus Poseidoniaceae archaeon]|nr:MAG TPA: hypothetical protein D7H84_00715 [Candidatus Poseidoniales archaeon]HII22757.1 hypothetical protein [Candidatus Poseidoniaceae archaeon]